MALKKSKTEKILEKDILKVVGFLAVLVVIYWIASTYFQSFNHFEYRGLEFTKEKFDKLLVYHYYYYYNNKEGQPVQYNLYLRNDPRTNNVSVEGKVSFEKPYVYVTFDSSYPSYCSDSTQSAVDLGLFLTQNQITVFNGLMNETEARESGQKHYSCDSLSNSVEVIELKGGNETKVVVNGNCHEIIVGPDCRIQEAEEKFKLETLINAREKALG